MDRVTLFCFAASYATALSLELWHQFRPRPILRLLGNIFGGAGLLAQTIYLAVQRPPLAWQHGWMLFLAWILAIFYFVGTFSHPRQAWGIFVLPLVLGLVGVAVLFETPPEVLHSYGNTSLQGHEILGKAHAWLLLLAAVGVCVSFLASLMYLVQAQRLKAKLLPKEGMRLPSLERLELMHRRAITLAFPLLTVGMLCGLLLMFRPDDEVAEWTDLRVLGALPLWIVFAILLYLRFALHLRGRRVAFLTIAAFGLLLVTFILPHMGRGVMP